MVGEGDLSLKATWLQANLKLLEASTTCTSAGLLKSAVAEAACDSPATGNGACPANVETATAAGATVVPTAGKPKAVMLCPATTKDDGGGGGGGGAAEKATRANRLPSAAFGCCATPVAVVACRRAAAALATATEAAATAAETVPSVNGFAAPIAGKAPLPEQLASFADATDALAPLCDASKNGTHGAATHGEGGKVIAPSLRTSLSTSPKSGNENSEENAEELAKT